jgi:hypothetical protein
MKRAIVFLTVFFIGAMCYTQQITVMIPPFTLVEGVSRTEADTITRLFLGRLSATGTVTIINTANLQQRMAAMNWEQSDWSNNDKKTKLNEGFNAEYLVIGTISNLFGDTIIDITAENMNTFVVVGSADTTLQRGTSPNEEINKLVAGIVQTMRGGNSGIRPGIANNKTYKVGDRGPAGGWIFYDKGVFSNGWRYLEAAPVDLGEAQWGGNDKIVGGTDEGVGAGKHNTQLILEQLRQLGESGKAAQLCVQYRGGGMSDWFLPSMDELNLMYENLNATGIGDFDDGLYWTSSEGRGSSALYWGRDSALSWEAKNCEFTVLAIRAF